jgi:hypothetical protein
MHKMIVASDTMRQQTIFAFFPKRYKLPRFALRYKKIGEVKITDGFWNYLRSRKEDFPDGFYISPSWETAIISNTPYKEEYLKYIDVYRLLSNT